jgi:hypothetical protein
MLKETLHKLYIDALDGLAKELGEFNDEANIWAVKNGIANSTGNLTLHLVGNLNHFIGATLGNTGYLRNRDSEFSDKNISRDELLTRIAGAKAVVNSSFEKITNDDLAGDYPIEFQGQTWKSGSVLIYMLGHFNHHLGQINYHRRFIDC